MEAEENEEAKRLKKQRLVIEEMIDTEGQYLSSLCDIIDGFLIPCREFRVDGELAFEADVIKLLFANIEAIRDLHEELFNSLQTVVDTPLYAGECFTDLQRRFKIYGEYCANVTTAEKLLIDLMADPTIGQILKRLCIECNKPLGLMAELHKPVQRILKYPLLFRELLKYSSEDDICYESAIQAQDTLSELANYINDVKRRAESCHQVLELQQQLSDYRGPDLLSFGLLLKADAVRIIDRKKRMADRHIFLFEKALLFAKRDESSKEERYGFKCYIEVSKLKYAELQDSATEKNMFEVSGMVEKKNVTFTIITKDVEEKKAWVREIKNLVDASFQTFLLKLRRPKENIMEEDGTRDLNMEQLMLSFNKQRALKKKLSSKKQGPVAHLQMDAFANLRTRLEGKSEKRRLNLKDIQVATAMPVESAPATPLVPPVADHGLNRSVSSSDISTTSNLLMDLGPNVRRSPSAGPPSRNLPPNPSPYKGGTDRGERGEKGERPRPISEVFAEREPMESTSPVVTPRTNRASKPVHPATWGPDTERGPPPPVPPKQNFYNAEQSARAPPPIPARSLRQIQSHAAIASPTLGAMSSNASLDSDTYPMEPAVPMDSNRPPLSQPPRPPPARGNNLHKTHSAPSDSPMGQNHPNVPPQTASPDPGLVSPRSGPPTPGPTIPPPRINSPSRQSSRPTSIGGNPTTFDHPSSNPPSGSSNIPPPLPQSRHRAPSAPASPGMRHPPPPPPVAPKPRTSTPAASTLNPTPAPAASAPGGRKTPPPAVPVKPPHVVEAYQQQQQHSHGLLPPIPGEKPHLPPSREGRQPPPPIAPKPQGPQVPRRLSTPNSSPSGGVS